MIPWVAFPEVVQRYAPFFAEVFSAEAFIEFKHYISGLIVPENKTVDGINWLFVIESRNQSSLNRLLTASPFSLNALNQARLAVLASVPARAGSPRACSVWMTRCSSTTVETSSRSPSCTIMSAAAMCGRTIW